MIDGQGRVIDYLRLSLTSECNLRCRYCLPEGRIASNSKLTLADFAFIVEVAAGLGIKRVRLTGGEPLLVQGLAEFVAEIRQYPGIRDIALTTNAQGLENHAAALFRAGVSRVNISLDSLQPERYAHLTRGGKLQVALKGVQAALEVGMSPVKINCVIMGGVNDDEIEAFALWTRLTPISVRFIELMPFGEAANWPDSSFVSVRAMKERLTHLCPHKIDVAGGGPAENFVITDGIGSIGFISGTTEHFCGNCNRLRVTSAGAIRPCLFSDLEFSLQEAVKNRDYQVLEQLLVEAAFLKPVREDSMKTKRMAEIGG